MTLINDGDLQLMNELFERYHVRIYNYCLKVTSNKAIGEDIAQETFYKVIKHRKSFKKKTFAAWIFTIARNLCFDYLKKEKSTQLNTESLQKNIDTYTYDDHEKRERIEHLERTLNKLDPIDKEVIILSRYENLKYKDIADIMDMSETAIKTRVHRALKKLRSYYFKAN